MPAPPSSRTIVYIDGFNLYYGLRADGLQRYYWLDMVALGRNLLRPGQTLALTKYFTARLAGPGPSEPPDRAARLQGKQQRQADYLDALGTLDDFRVYEGHYLPKPMKCFACDNRWNGFEEKMTDVNIATELLVDAFQDRFDVALVVSADSDLAPPIVAVRQNFPDKRVVVARPPRRNSVRLNNAAHAHLVIGRDTLRDSQLPEQITLPNGHVLARPQGWN